MSAVTRPEPGIGVLLPIYRESKEMVQTSIESMLAQTYRPLHIYLAYDDPDGPLQNLLGEYEIDHDEITLIKNKQNLGLVDNLNSAIQAISEPLIARMDADDISYPKRLEDEFRFLRENNLDFAMSGIDLLTPQGETARGRAYPRLLTNDLVRIQSVLNVSLHPTWLLKKQVYAQLGGYRHFDSCEDLDFMLRALQAGIAVGRLDSPTVLYRTGNDSISTGNYRQQFLTTVQLHKLFSEGVDIASLSPEAIVETAMQLSELPDERFNKAKSSIDRFSYLLAKRQYPSAALLAFRQSLTDKLFRKLFAYEAKRTIKANRICRKSRSEAIHED